MTRKQVVDKAIADEARRIKEQEQGVVKVESGASMSYSTAGRTSVRSNIDPTILKMLQDMGLTPKDKK